MIPATTEASTTTASLSVQRVQLLRGASIEILAKDTVALADISWLAPGSTVFLPALPSQNLNSVLDAARALRHAGFEPVPHLAARRVPSRAELRMFLRAAHAESNVQRVMLIGGDAASPSGPYADSLDVMEDGVLNDAGITAVSVAGYPEGHPEIDAARISAALDRKVALADAQGLTLSIVSQFSFAPSRIVGWCGRMQRDYPRVPVFVGIAGPTDPVALLRYAQRCGVSASRRALKQLGTGIARLVMNTDPADQVLALARYCEKVPCNLAGIHVYSFGGAARTAHWLRDQVGA